jgi:predicted RNA methylase
MQSKHWSILKLSEAVKRGYFRTVDLFAGCGGMTLGFHHAKYRCIAAIEIDDNARKSHEKNFSRFMPLGGYATIQILQKLIHLLPYHTYLPYFLILKAK